MLRPSGELDINQQRDLELALTEACAGRPLTVVDLADVTLLDCSAVGVLLAGAERCRRQGHDFVVLNVHGLVARTFEVFNLTGLLGFIDTGAGREPLTLVPGRLTGPDVSCSWRWALICDSGALPLSPAKT